MAALRIRPLSVKVMDTRSAREPPKRADPFYLTPEWRAVVAQVREVRADRCEVCHRTGTRLFADHRIAVKDGGGLFDVVNIQLLCGSCHSLKSHAERLKRMAEPI
jgi:hypothetical protein